LFGSTVLAERWSSYYCATQVDAKACASDPPPLLADDGTPVLAGYPGAWGGSALASGRLAVELVEERPLVGAARVRRPRRADPFDARSKATTIDVLVPWVPKQPGTGFGVPVSGMRDKFIQTAQLDFSGVTTTLLVDYDDSGAARPTSAASAPGAQAS